jgi:hypothetical protein
MNLKSPIILDNLFSDEYIKKIEESCIESSWGYSNNITYGENYDNIQNGFSFTFENNSLQYFLFQYLILKSCEKINFKVEKSIRIRKRLTYPNKEKYNIPYQPHIDFEDNHLVLLYYVNDSNGDTFVYKEKFSKKNKLKWDKINVKKFSLLEKVKFKRGRVAIFDGKHYHASSLSSSNPRIILNVNLYGKFIRIY